MSNAQDIIKELNQMGEFIEKAQTSLNKGKVVRLSHLDEKVAQLCEKTLTLDPEEARTVQPAMAEMIAKLENLALALQSFQGNLQNKIEP